ncbi:MAG: MBL fold metallo-hydrolase [Clostridiales bacterium]|nr:MBL fold metallo-hydrolase [Clostridiales bacterium]
MKLTVLGNNGPYPCKGGACSGYLLTSDSGDTCILIDCGTGVLARLQEAVSLGDIDAVVLSHLHFDHMSDMLPMQYALQFNPREKALPVIAPATPEPVRALLQCPHYDLWPTEDTTIGEMRISFSPARHPVETYAVCVSCDGAKFVFTGDSNQDLLMELFCEGADLLLADAGLSKADHRFTSPHYSAEMCGQLAKNAHVRKLVLTHFNPKYDKNDLLAEAQCFFAETAIAEIGEEYYI